MLGLPQQKMRECAKLDFGKFGYECEPGKRDNCRLNWSFVGNVVDTPIAKTPERRPSWKQACRWKMAQNGQLNCNDSSPDRPDPGECQEEKSKKQ